MRRKILFLLLIVLLTAGTITSCYQIPSSSQRDWREQGNQEQMLDNVIQQQSG